MSTHALEASVGVSTDRLLASLLEAAPDAVVCVDREGRIVVLNDQTRRMFGYAGDELLGRQVDVLLPGRFRARHRHHRAAYLAEPGTRPMGPGLDLAGLRKDGTEFPVDVTLSTIEVDGEPLVLASIRDATERNASERAIRELASIVESSNDAIVSKSLDGTIVSWNAAATRCYGYSSLEAIGRNISMLAPPDRLHEIGELLEQLRVGERIEQFETVRQRKDGTLVHVALTLSPVRDRNGLLVGASTIARDISDRIRAEQRFNAVVESSPDAVVCADGDGRIVLLNEQTRRMFGYTGDELLGERIETLLPDRFRARHRAHRTGYLTDPRGRAMGLGLDLLGLRKDGTEFPVDVSLSTMDAGDGPLVLAFIRDVTEARRLQTEKHEFELSLRDAQRLESLGVLAGGVAHDFNNLLSVILGNTSLLLTQLPERSELRQVAAQTELAAHHAAQLTRQLLAYARKGKYVVQPLRLSEVVEELRDLIEATISKKARLELSFDPDTPVVEADLTQLRQVVLNLISNASDALEDRPGTVTVAARALVADRATLSQYELAEGLGEGPYAFVEVRDTGAGMDPSTRERIFDPFFTTKSSGRGLGLAAVLGIVGSHGGAIRVESAPHEGTAFQLLLPASGRDAVSPPTLPESDWRGSGTVLVADDDESVGVVASAMLQHLGFDVVRVTDGREALTTYAEHRGEFAFLLLDLTMPTGGEDVLDELERAGATTPIVLFSGYNAQELSQRFAERRVATFLQKPFELGELLAAARQAVESRPELRTAP
jgi:two-component system cell cycle sensor histidine kinase/response regulator CckA